MAAKTTKTGKVINVALIGQAFMGRAHSNAWSQVNRFVIRHLSCVTYHLCRTNSSRACRTVGWQHYSTDWKAVCRDPGGLGGYWHAELPALVDGSCLVSRQACSL